MKIDRIMEILDAKICTEFPYDDIDIHTACGTDLMSDALAYADNKGLLLTGLNNPQSIRTAEMMDICCVVIVRGKEPDPGLVSLAQDKEIVVLRTNYPMFTACGLLYEAGVAGGEVRG